MKTLRNLRNRIAFVITLSMVLSMVTPAFAEPIEDEEAYIMDADVTSESQESTVSDSEAERREKEASAEADKIISSVVTDDMNELEKAFYLFLYIRKNAKYSYFSRDLSKSNKFFTNYFYKDGNMYIKMLPKETYIDRFYPIYPAVSLEELKSLGYRVDEWDDHIKIYSKYCEEAGDPYLSAPYIGTQDYIDKGCFIENGWVYLRRQDEKGVLTGGYNPDFPMIGTEEFKNKGYKIIDNEVCKDYDLPIKPEDYDPYEMEVIKKYGHIYDQEAYGALIQKLAVCGGFAEAYKLFMDKLNIQCNIREFMTDGGAHATNLIQIKDKWIEVDPTNIHFNIKWDSNGNETSGIAADLEARKLYEELYGTEMPKRTMFGEEWGGPFSHAPNKLEYPWGYIEVAEEVEYNGKKQKPVVTVYYNGQTYTSEKGGALKVSYIRNKDISDENDIKKYGLATIKKLKGKAKKVEGLDEVIAKSVNFKIVPKKATSENTKYKLKNGMVKSVKVQIGNKYKKVNKKYWSMSGNCIVFSGNFTGTVSVNELS